MFEKMRIWSDQNEVVSLVKHYIIEFFIVLMFSYCLGIGKQRA